jgi:hypothetical protein
MSHKHECPDCGTWWEHDEPLCDEPERQVAMWPSYARCVDCDGSSYSGASLEETAH